MEVQMPRQMAYDRAIVVFSPEGRMYQVEYARKAVSRASTTLGIVFKDSVVLAGIKQTSKLLVTDKGEKIAFIDKHIIAAACGILADSRVLVDFARIKAQINRITYEQPIEVGALVKEISDRKQRFTQVAGLRPYGVSMLIAGIDGAPHLFETDPSGTIREWQAHAIGRGASKATAVFEKEYKSDLDEEKAIKLAVKALKADEQSITTENTEIGIVTKDSVKIFSSHEIKKYL